MTTTICDMANNMMHSASAPKSAIGKDAVFDESSSFIVSKEVAKSALFFSIRKSFAAASTAQQQGHIQPSARAPLGDTSIEDQVALGW